MSDGWETPSDIIPVVQLRWLSSYRNIIRLYVNQEFFYPFIKKYKNLGIKLCPKDASHNFKPHGGVPQLSPRVRVKAFNGAMDGVPGGTGRR